MVSSLLLEMSCGFSTMGIQPISAKMCLITSMPHMTLDGLDDMGQSLGYHVHQIYQLSTYSSTKTSHPSSRSSSPFTLENECRLKKRFADKAG